jgi:hypothetical protein
VVVYRRFGGLAGSLYLAAVAVLIPVLIALYFKFFPRSPMGRWLMIRKTPDAGGGPGGGAGAEPSAEQGPYEELAGREGRTLTVLRPVGGSGSGTGSTARSAGRVHRARPEGRGAQGGRSRILVRAATG